MKKLIARLKNRKQDQEDNKFFTLTLVLVAAASMLLCIWIGMSQNIWFDEAYSIVTAQQPIDKIIQLSALDTHPPLYYILLKAWAGIFGWSEMALRSLSVVMYGGSLVFAGLLIRKCFGPKAAVAALMFLVLSPLLMRYGFEIRMYAMASFIGILATYVMVIALEAKKNERVWLWGIYAILVALGVYTLYYMAFLWMAHFVWLLFMTFRKKSQRNLHKAPWLYAYGVSALLFLPWLPRFGDQLHNSALAPIGQIMNIQNLLGVVSFNFLYQPVWNLNMPLTILLIFIIITLAVVLVRAWHMHEHREYFLLLVSYIAIPVIILMLVSFIRPMYVERYLSHVAIGLMMLVGVAVWLAEQHKPSKAVRICAGLLIVVMAVGFSSLVNYGNYNFQRLQKPNMDAVTAELQGCKDGDAIVAADPYVAIELMANMPQCAVHFYSDTADLKGGYAPLAGSPLRVENPVPKFENSKVVHYVYYDEPKLQLDKSYLADTRHSLGPVTVATYSVKD